MRTKRVLAAIAGLALALPAGGAIADQGDFSPVATFELSDTRVKANPQLKLHVEQEDNEEELARVSLTIPKGFSLPTDEQIPGGDQLGAGEIVIHVGPGCRPGPEGQGTPTAASAPLPATLAEVDRTDEQADRGINSVWNLDISGVTDIFLEVTGSKKLGWKLEGDVPPNDNTCPPFSFDLNVNSQSASGVPIIVNPKKPGKAKFSGSFYSLNSPTIVTIDQVIKITK